MKQIIIFLFITLVSPFFNGQVSAQSMNTDSTYNGTNADILIMQYGRQHSLKLTKSPSGLYYVIKKPGNGPAVKDSQQVSIKYKGSLTNGMIFDSNMKRKYGHKAPFEFRVGSGQVIKGFDEGTRLLNEGGSILIIIPPSLGYGEKEVGPIPANSILIFELRLLKVSKKDGC